MLKALSTVLGNLTPKVTPGDLATFLRRGSGNRQARPSGASGDRAPRKPRRGGSFPVEGWAWTSQLHRYWPRVLDWRVRVTGRAHPLGNVSSLLRS